MGPRRTAYPSVWIVSRPRKNTFQQYVKAVCGNEPSDHPMGVSVCIFQQFIPNRHPRRETTAMLIRQGCWDFFSTNVTTVTAVLSLLLLLFLGVKLLLLLVLIYIQEYLAHFVCVPMVSYIPWQRECMMQEWVRSCTIPFAREFSNKAATTRLHFSDTTIAKSSFRSVLLLLHSVFFRFLSLSIVSVLRYTSRSLPIHRVRVFVASLCRFIIYRYVACTPLFFGSYTCYSTFFASWVSFVLRIVLPATESLLYH